MKLLAGAALAAFLLAGVSAPAEPRSGEDEPKALDFPGGDIFGFTSPTDVGNPGDKGIAFETSTRIGKPGGGSYWSPTLKTQLSATVAPNLAVAVSPFLTGHRIRAVPGLDDRSSVAFDGASGEVAYRFLERSATNPLAATASVEARGARVDPLTGERVSAYGVELKLFLDTVIVPERLYGGVNLNFATGQQRAFAPFDAKWEKGSGTNLSGALAYQVTDRFFLGAEARFLTAFAGSFLNDFSGRALFFGPTMLVRLSDTAALNIAWTPQVGGRADGAGARPLDLDNFERHQLRVKLSTSF